MKQSFFTYHLQNLKNNMTENLSLLAELRIPIQGMNVEQHRSTGIGYICTVNTSILPTCQTLNKKKKNTPILVMQRYKFTSTNYKKKKKK